MNTNILLYKLLFFLQNKNIKTLKLDDLFSIHSDFLDFLKEYNLNYYYKKFENPKFFLHNILYIFSSFEFGIYNNSEKTMIFYDDPMIVPSLIKYNINVNDKLINELALILSILLNEKKTNTR